MKKKQPEYKIEKTLFSSEKVNIYLTTKNNLKLNYIMKQITIGKYSKEDMELIISEAKLLSLFDYKFVLKTVDYFQIKDIYYVIVEYCDGGTLEDYIHHMKKSKKHIKEELIWKIFIQISLGIAYLHRNHLIHRNIKPSNILLTKDFKAKIKGMKDSKKLIDKRFTNSIVGTPYYLAPEIWEERPYDRKVDIWALGILLYELCALTVPFKGVNTSELIINIKEDKIEPIPKIYSKELQGFISYILNNDELSRPTIDEIILTYLFISKSKSVYLYDYTIKLYPDIEEKKLFVKSIKDRTNEKKVYLKKNAIEMYLDNTKTNYSNFFNQLKNIPIDVDLFNTNSNKDLNIQSITRFLGEETKENSGNTNYNQDNPSSSQFNEQNMSNTFVPLVINNETNFDFKVIDINSLQPNIDDSIGIDCNKDKNKGNMGSDKGNGKSKNNGNDNMVKITQAKLQRFQWIYEIEEKIDYIHGEISSILSDHNREQIFNDLINNNKVNEDLFEQEPYSDPLLKKSYYNLVYYKVHLDNIKKEIFNDS